MVDRVLRFALTCAMFATRSLAQDASPAPALDTGPSPIAPAAEEGTAPPSREETEQPGQEGAPSAAQALAAQEAVRARFEAIIAELDGTAGGTEIENPRLFYTSSDRLEALGPAAGPFLISELERQSRATFHIVSYVLGKTRPPGAEQALRKAAERTGRDGSPMGRNMQAWAHYGLAILGVPDAVDLLTAGAEPTGRIGFMEHMSLLEVGAILTAPESTPRLLERLDGWRSDPDRQVDVVILLDAFGGVAETATVPRILPLLEDGRSPVRVGAIRALKAIGDPSVADRLIALLASEDDDDRLEAALALQELAPVGKDKALMARLEVETRTSARVALYRTLAATLGDGAIEAFVSHWGRKDPLDRLGLLTAVARTRSSKGLNLLRAGLRDGDPRVVVHAMEGLARIGGAGAMDTLLALLRDVRDAVSESAIELLGHLRERRAGPRLADILLEDLRSPRRIAIQRPRVMKLGEALVALRYVDLLPDLRKAVQSESDPIVKEYLERLVRRLGAIESLKDDRAKWVHLLDAEDPDLRSLAYARLGELGGDEAAKALTAAFGHVGVLEDVDLLRGLGETRSQEAVPLLERILLDPVFDLDAAQPLRDMAAWSARRIGGPRMGDALRRSAQRRDGRDIHVLVYLAQLTGTDAVPLLKSLRGPRLRSFEFDRGLEQERIDWLVRELMHGRPIDSLDRPPDEIAFH